MNKIDEMIRELCLEGVKRVKLGEVGSFYNGVTGKSKEDFVVGNAKFITYMNIFTNAKLNVNVDDRIRIVEGEKQNLIKYGDILFTTSSETPDECGMSSVLTERIEESLYLNSFCFGFRFNDLSLVEPSFCAYLFRTDSIRREIAKTANGVTRFNISKKLFEKLSIPLPPLAIQQEIVSILDSFSSLQSKLEEELSVRQKQMEFYREKLLTFDKDDNSVKWMKVSEISTKICSGGTPNRSVERYFSGDILWLRTQEVDWNEIYDTEIKITEEAVANSSAKIIPANCVIIAMYGATAGKACINKVPLTTNQACCNVAVNSQVAEYKYLYYYICSRYEHIKGLGEGSQNNINAQKIKEYPIPIPPLSRQQEIVSTLDTMSSLIDKLKEEIELRKKQYEYYREALLSF